MTYKIRIPTYIINLPKRIDRLAHVLSQFEDKEEFEINVIAASEHEIGAFGLWLSICKIIKIAIEKGEDVIILCEDDHEFTENYNCEKLIEAIYEAHSLNANLLLGGISGGLTNALVLKSGLIWLDTFWGTHFVVIYSSFYEMILNEPFSEKDVADGKFSEMTSNKFIIYPMISMQKGFGYSDVSRSNNNDTHLHYLNQSITLRMEKIYTTYLQTLNP